MEFVQDVVFRNQRPRFVARDDVGRACVGQDAAQPEPRASGVPALP